MMYGLKSIKNMDKRLAVPILVAALLVGVFVFVAVGKGGEMHIKGTDGDDSITIDEPGSTILCTTCDVKGDATLVREGEWKIDAGGEGNNHYKIDTDKGNDIITINDGDGKDKYEVKAGAGDDAVSINDGTGDDKYDVKGDTGSDTVDYADSPGDEDKIDMDT